MKLKTRKRAIILNAKGEQILLNEPEQAIANVLQIQSEPFQNALGFEIDITTLTTIVKKVSEQKFFEVAPADFLPLRVGEGAWSTQLTTYRSFQVADDFETGVINTGGNNGRLASADSGVDSLSVVVRNWAKASSWSLMELNQAAKAGNWDLVTSKEEARKKNWDLGIQRTAFLGSKGDAFVKGLLTQTGITTDAATVTGPISLMSPVDFNAFCAKIVNAYRANCNRTAWPTHFIIPESDYLGLASASSPDFPLVTKLEFLEKMFKLMTKKADFKILPLSYCDAAYNTNLVGVQLYVLLNYDEKSIRMDLPVDYTSTLANSLDNFSFQNVGYGQFSGVLAYRPLEMLYLTCAVVP